jgi:hypothetical protein
MLKAHRSTLSRHARSPLAAAARCCAQAAYLLIAALALLVSYMVSAAIILRRTEGIWRLPFGGGVLDALHRACMGESGDGAAATASVAVCTLVTGAVAQWPAELLERRRSYSLSSPKSNFNFGCPRHCTLVVRMCCA